MSEQFPWLQGLTDWYYESPVPNALEFAGQVGQDANAWIGRTAAAAAAPYFMPDQTGGKLDAALTVGQNLANSSAAGLLSLGRLGGEDGLNNAVNSINHAQQNFGRQPATPAGQAYIGALESAGEPVQTLKTELGEQGQPYGPAAATAGYMAPDILAMLTGTGALRGRPPRQMNAGELFGKKLDGPTPTKPSPFNVEGVTGRGGPGRHQEGAVRITGKNRDGQEEYGPLKTKTAASTPLFGFPDIDAKLDTPVKHTGSLFSSEVPEAMRNTQRKKGSGNDWAKEFKRLGIGDEELQLSGILPLLQASGDAEVSRTDIEEAYNTAKQRGTGAVWASGDDVAERVMPGVAPGEIDRARTASQDSEQTVRARANTFVLNDSPGIEVSGSEQARNTLSGILNDGEYYDNNEGRWLDVASGSAPDRGMESYRTYLVDQGVGDADVDAIVADVTNLRDSRRALAALPNPNDVGPAGNESYGYKDDYKYPGSISDQRWAYQLPDAYGQAELGESPYTHFDELGKYGMKPNYEPGGPTVPWSHNRLGVYPVMSEPTWTDPDGSTMRATTLDIFESQFDPPSHTGYGLTNVRGMLERRRGPRRPRTEETEKEKELLYGRGEALEENASKIRNRSMELGGEIATLRSELPESLRSGFRRLVDRAANVQTDMLDLPPAGDTHPRLPPTELAVDLARGNLKRLSEIPEELNRADMELEVRTLANELNGYDRDTVGKFNDYIAKNREHAAVGDQLTETDRNKTRTREEAEYYENIDTQLLPDYFPLTDDWSKRMLPHIGRAVDEAIKGDHEFVSWSTQRGQGEAYSYAHVGPEQEAMDRFYPKRHDAGWDGEKFVDTKTGEEISADRIDASDRADMKADPVGDRELTQQELTELNYTRLENEIDNELVHGDSPRLQYGDENAIVDAQTGIEYPARRSIYRVAAEIYFDENPGELWSAQRLAEEGAIRPNRIKKGTIKRVTIPPEPSDARMSNPDEGVLDEFGGIYMPKDERREYSSTNPYNDLRRQPGVNDRNSLNTRGAAKRYYHRDFVQGNFTRFLRALGMKEADISEAVTDIDMGISSQKLPGRKQNRPALKVTPALKKAWEDRPTGGIWGYRPIPSNKPKKSGRANPGKIIGAFKQGKLERADAVEQLKSAGVPEDRIDRMLGT